MATRTSRRPPLWIACTWAAMASVGAQTPTYTVIHNFRSFPHGWAPFAPLIQDNRGNFYGTTNLGGAAEDIGNLFQNAGVVFKLDTTGKQTVLHSFRGGTDGASPYAGLTVDSAGNLYGTTANGRTGVYRLSTAGELTVICRFPNTSAGSLIRDEAGNLYGTTNMGERPGCLGMGCGGVYQVDPSGHRTVLHRFGHGTYTDAGLTLGPAGSIYGVTTFGGAKGGGEVFRIDLK